MGCIERMLLCKDGPREWFVLVSVGALAALCMFFLFAPCEKEEPPSGRTQVGTHMIVDVEAVLEFQAREAEKGK